MPISRKKACFHCRVAKTRCDLARPCYRCSRRSLCCHYRDSSAGPTPYSPEPIQQGHLSTSRVTDVAADSIQQDSTDIGGTIEVGQQLHTSPILAHVFECTNYIPQAFSFQFEGGPRRPAPECSEIDRLFSGPVAFGDILDMPSPFNIPAQLSEVAGQSPNISPAAPINQTEHPLHTEDSPLLELVTIYSKAPHGILSPKRLTTPKSVLTRQLLWGQVKSFPKTIIQGSLPPFIYPPCVLDDKLSKNCIANGVHQCLPESLANCASLVGLFYKRTSTNSRLFWNSLYDELKLLQSEVLLMFTQCMHYGESSRLTTM
jgi:hypothetical protein